MASVNLGKVVGDSAYEVAVSQGFVGTEAEWLASLKGTDGTDGFSPIANVVKTGSVATITITDALGTTTASVYDGTSGGGMTPQDVKDLIQTEYGMAKIQEECTDLDGAESGVVMDYAEGIQVDSWQYYSSVSNFIDNYPHLMVNVSGTYQSVGEFDLIFDLTPGTPSGGSVEYSGMPINQPWGWACKLLIEWEDYGNNEYGGDPRIVEASIGYVDEPWEAFSFTFDSNDIVYTLYYQPLEVNFIPVADDSINVDMLGISVARPLPTTSTASAGDVLTVSGGAAVWAAPAATYSDANTASYIADTFGMSDDGEGNITTLEHKFIPQTIAQSDIPENPVEDDEYYETMIYDSVVEGYDYRMDDNDNWNEIREFALGTESLTIHNTDESSAIEVVADTDGAHINFIADYNVFDPISGDDLSTTGVLSMDGNGDLEWNGDTLAITSDIPEGSFPTVSTMSGMFGKVLAVNDGEDGYDLVSMPRPDGTTITASNGIWSASIPSVNTLSAGSGITLTTSGSVDTIAVTTPVPTFSAADDGKVLTLTTSGTVMSWETPSGGGASTVIIENNDDAISGLDADEKAYLVNAINNKQDYPFAILSNGNIYNPVYYRTGGYYGRYIMCWGASTNITIKITFNNGMTEVTGYQLLDMDSQDVPYMYSDKIWVPANRSITGANSNVGANLSAIKNILNCPTTTDGTYVLKATVASGEVTYAWVAETV